MQSETYEIRRPPRFFDYTLRMILDYGGENYECDIPTSNLVSFTHTRVVGDKANTFTFTIKGKLALDLEYKILSGNHKVLITYGMQGETLKIFTGEITAADIKFEGLSLAIVFSGVSSVFTNDNVKRRVIYKKGTSVYKILSLMCTAHNWILGDYVTASDLPEDLVQSDQSDTDFLVDVLSEKIYSLDRGINNYKVWFTVDGSQIVLNYAPLCYQSTISKYKFVYDLNGSANSRMLSFEVKDMGKFAFSVGTSLNSKVVDPDTGELVEDTSSNVSEGYVDVARKYEGYLGNKLRLAFNNNNSSTVKSSLLAHSKNKMNSYWQQMYNQNYTATATLIGDTAIDSGESIEVIVMTEDDIVHYSSGTYKITEMKDVIEGGAFVSELSLVKTVSRIGD